MTDDPTNAAGDVPGRRHPSLQGGRELFWSVLKQVKALRAEGRDDEADRALVAVALRLPEDPEAARHAAWSAMGRRDWPEAVRRWRSARARFPDIVEAYVEAGLAHRALGELSQAEALLEAGVRRFPHDPPTRWHHALNAERRGDGAAAEERWRAFCAMFPHDPLGRAELQRVGYERRTHAITRGRPAVQSAPALGGERGAEVSEDAAAMEPKRVLGAFVGLGENCEFGFVQRHFGAEPLSLLRWGYVSLEMLLRGLEDGFVGVGDPDHTRLDPNEAGELMASDARYFQYIHTHVHRDTVDPAAFLNEMCRRLDFLKRKLVSDLRKGSKIFVYKRTSGFFHGQESALLSALRRYGDNRLLCVAPPGPARPCGTVEPIADGLAAAYLPIVDRPLRAPVAYDAWLAVAQRALSVLARR